jgi:predicted nucleotidyltransferase
VASWPEFDAVALLRPFVRRGVDFVVIGGIAMVAHGSARITRDLDVCFAADPTNLCLLAEALIDLGATTDEDVSLPPDAATLARSERSTVTTPAGPLDLQRRPPGAPPYAELRGRAERIEVGGIGVLVASLDDLEAMKRAAGRPIDAIDLEEIAVIRRLRARQ